MFSLFATTFFDVTEKPKTPTEDLETFFNN